MSRLSKTSIIQIAAYVYAELRQYGVHINSAAATTNSVYIVLGSHLGQLRISDHRGGKHRWNIVIGGVDLIRNRQNFATERTYPAFVEYIKTQLMQRVN